MNANKFTKCILKIWILGSKASKTNRAGPGCSGAVGERLGPNV